MRMANIFTLSVKELRSLARDPVMIALIVYAFSIAIYTAAEVIPETLNKAPIAVVDEDRSALSMRVAAAFYPPYFTPPIFTTLAEMDSLMDKGLITFALDIPPNFQRDVLAGNRPTVQLNVDATRMSQAFSGGGYVETIATGEVTAFLQRYRATTILPIELALRTRFNATLKRTWFGAVVEVINQITMLSMVLTGAALIREREHGTIEHLLVMPVTPFEIMMSKVLAMGLVVLVASAASLIVIVQGLLVMPIQGSIALFLTGAVFNLFATTSLGIFLATIARSMPQFALLFILIALPLQLLSGGVTPAESMPWLVRDIMLATPTTHFILLAQNILFRGSGFGVVWPQLLTLSVIGTGLFGIALVRFRKTISEMQ